MASRRRSRTRPRLAPGLVLASTRCAGREEPDLAGVRERRLPEPWSEGIRVLGEVGEPDTSSGCKQDLFARVLPDAEWIETTLSVAPEVDCRDRVGNRGHAAAGRILVAEHDDGCGRRGGQLGKAADNYKRIQKLLH